MRAALRVSFAPPTMRLVAVHAAWPGYPLLPALSDKDSIARCQDSSSVSVCVQKNMHRLFILLTMACCPADVLGMPRIMPCEPLMRWRQHDRSKGCSRDNAFLASTRDM